MRLNILLVLSLTLFPALALTTDIVTHRLGVTYAVNEQICKEAARLLQTDKACRPFDALHYSDEEAYAIAVGGKRTPAFEELATNQYGYTQVFRATVGSIQEYAIVYLNRFQGDRHPRLVQTWKVDAKALEEVLRLPPGPIPSERWKTLQPRYPRDTNAAEFAAVLQRGEQVSNEWSPVIEIAGNPYLVERECSGVWVYGGYYACQRVIKLTVKKLAYEKTSMPYCQFARRHNQ